MNSRLGSNSQSTEVHERTPSSTDLFSIIAGERLRLADLLEGLTNEEWESPSSCSGWSIRVLAAHLIAGPEVGMRGLGAELFRSRGNPDVANDSLARRMAERHPTKIVESMRKHAHSKFAPPILGAAAPLTDIVIHALDVTSPIGRHWEPPLEATRVALRSGTDVKFQTANHYRRFKGLEFKATDTDWHWGSGQQVTGSAVDLAHIIWGRSDAIDSLSGPGVGQLSGALAPIH